MLDAGNVKMSRGRKRPAYNMILFCKLKFRHPYWDSAKENDEMGVATAHMHFVCAKNQQQWRHNLQYLLE